MLQAILPESRPSLKSSGTLVSIGQAAKLASVDPQTIRRYMASGLIEGLTTPGGHRRLNIQSVAEAFGVSLPDDGQEAEQETTGRVCVLFSRVSTNKQQTAGDLDRQTDALKAYAAEHYAGMRTVTLRGVGSGLSDTRPEFLRLIDLIVAGRVAVVLCSYRDRIARFGVNVIYHLCKANGTELVEIKTGDDEDRAATLEEEAMKDCMAVLHCFSNRMMGRRGGAKVKVVFPAGFRERVAQLAGSGLSRRDIVAAIEAEPWVCQNTGKRLAERSVRRVMEQLRDSGSATIPQSVRRFLKARCVVGAAKRARSADLYAAYVAHCQQAGCPALGRDKWTEFVKQTVPNCRLENDQFTTMFGLALKASA